MTDGPASPVQEGATRGRTVAAALAVLFLIIGLPAILYAAAGQTRVAVGLVVVFLIMVALTAYGLSEAVKARRKQP